MFNHHFYRYCFDLSWPFTELCQPRLSWKDWCRRELPSHWSHPADGVKLSIYKNVQLSSTHVDQYVATWVAHIAYVVCPDAPRCLSTASVLTVASCLWSQSLISLARRSAKQRTASGPRSREAVKCSEVPHFKERCEWYDSMYWYVYKQNTHMCAFAERERERLYGHIGSYRWWLLFYLQYVTIIYLFNSIHIWRCTHTNK